MSTTEIRHEIEIDAPPAAVWSVLADTSRYPDWNPFVESLTGELRPGARLEARIAPPGGRPLTFKPVVVCAEPGRELRWLGRFLVPGLLDGEHSFRLEPLPSGGTRFVQSERFSGLLVGPLRRMLRQTVLGFAQMNHALRQQAEGRT